jgi:type VI secretion system protein ImpI
MVASAPEAAPNPFLAAKSVASAAPPTPQSEAAPVVVAEPASTASADAFVARFAAAAGIPLANLAGQDPLAIAQKAGEITRAVVVNMMQLLSARSEAKRMVRNSNQTFIQALDNNPLKFSPTPEEALRVMLGPQTKSYLDSKRALAQGFDDLKMHQVLTYSAMQAAMQMIAEELDPESIEKSVPASGGFAELIGSRKARLWEAYAARWKAKTERHDNGLVDVFMLYFAQCYDNSTNDEK